VIITLDLQRLLLGDHADPDRQRAPDHRRVGEPAGAVRTNQNLIAAAALMAAVPTLIVYLVLQKQVIAGLSLGSTKG
jgi:multiple sugar transport system permease protein